MAEQSDKTGRKIKTRYLVIAIIVILIIAAIILIPRYNRYLQNKRAAEIRSALELVRNTIDQEWKSTGTISGIRMESILQKAEVPAKVSKNWTFVVAWKDSYLYTTEMVEKLKDVNDNSTVYVAPYRIILAYAKPENPLGEGTKIWFKGDTNSYHGFGVDTKIEPDWVEIFPEP